MKRVLLATFLVFAGFGAFYLVKLGAFAPVSFDVKTMGPYKMIYKDHVGPYHKIGPFIQDVQKFVLSQNEVCESFGEFIDDPSRVEHIRLRSRAGCLMKADSSIDLNRLSTDLHGELRTAREYLVGEFSGSPALGPYKVYDAVDKELRQRGLQPDGPAIEIYHDLPSGLVRTEYLFPVKK